MSDVRVHYNSDKLAEVGALAYTQGTNIHVAPGQERHLPHEAWHVVQQAQDRVKPTMQAKEVSINDDAGLEREADVMGLRTASIGMTLDQSVSIGLIASIGVQGSLAIQRYLDEGQIATLRKLLASKLPKKENTDAQIIVSLWISKDECNEYLRSE